MTCESTVSVCGCVRVSQEPLSWCSLIRDAKHRPPPPLPSLSFLLREPMIPLGRVQNASTVYLLSVPYDPSPSEPHNHRLWHQFSYWQLISLQSAQTRIPTPIPRTNPDLPGRQAALLFTHCPSTDHGRNIATLSGPATYLEPASFHVSNNLILVVYIHVPHFAYPNFPTMTEWSGERAKKRTTDGENLQKKVKYRWPKKEKNTFMWSVVSTEMYTVCCITRATCSESSP